MSLDYRINRREFISTSAKGIAAISALGVTNLKGDNTASSSSPVDVPDKVVVLTFDDALKSHLTFVAPLLKELIFGPRSLLHMPGCHVFGLFPYHFRVRTI
jgi:hypothetical protein